MARQYLKRYRCEFCKGDLVRKCDVCNGKGVKPGVDNLLHSCKACNATGKVKCNKCNNGMRIK